ncbi:MAG: aspartate dehydrogenase [Firmicutes bacterium]|nr:aspartate dehydrogenase [Bacillota bacterium]
MFFKKRAETKTYDPSAQKPMLHKSICTGETTAGFKDLATGKYMDVMLVRNEKDLKKFMSTYAINTKPETEY